VAKIFCHSCKQHLKVRDNGGKDRVRKTDAYSQSEVLLLKNRNTPVEQGVRKVRYFCRDCTWKACDDLGEPRLEI